MAPAKYIATWKEGILWGRDRHSCLCGQLTCKITGLFCIWEGINNKWMTTHIDVHPTMQCALFLSFSPWCFTSPKVIFFFLPCSEAPQLQTLPWCLSGKHRKLNYRKKNPKQAKKILGLFRQYQNSPVCWSSAYKADVPSGTSDLFRELWTHRHQMASAGLCSSHVCQRQSGSD